MNPSRERWVAVALCVLGSALLLLAASQRWVHVVVAEPDFPRVVVEATGRKVAPGVAAIGLVGLAGAIALLVTRRVGRVVTGVLLTVLGLVVVATAVAVAGDLAGAVQGTLDDAVGRSGAVPTSVDGSPWPWAAVAGGVLIALGGLLAVVRGARWPGPTRRYETAPPAATDPALLPPDERADAMWKALDRGEDPTAAGDDAADPPSQS